MVSSEESLFNNQNVASFVKQKFTRKMKQLSYNNLSLFINLRLI